MNLIAPEPKIIFRPKSRGGSSRKSPTNSIAQEENLTSASKIGKQKRGNMKVSNRRPTNKSEN